MIQSLTAKIIICQNTGFAGVVARVESLPFASLGDFVRGRMGASQSTRQVDGLFESVLSESFGG